MKTKLRMAVDRMGSFPLLNCWHSSVQLEQGLGEILLLDLPY